MANARRRLSQAFGSIADRARYGLELGVLRIRDLWGKIRRALQQKVKHLLERARRVKAALVRRALQQKVKALLGRARCVKAP